ncbi:hypothetical protein DFH11DRAFT_1648537, partial [Phellopilus nigrolimitatus]
DALLVFPSILPFHSPFLFVFPHLHICRPTHSCLCTFLVSAAFFLMISSTHLYILQHSFHAYIYNNFIFTRESSC